MFENIQRIPDVVMVENDPAQPDEMKAGCFRYKDVCVETKCEDDRLAVWVTAGDSPLCKVRLRWHFAGRLRGQVLGDAWERSYGDLAWHNILPYQTLPWYALVKQVNGTTGYGVRVRPAAICSWMIDTEGITLWLDVRCGGEGVLLAGRRLLAAEGILEATEPSRAHKNAMS